MRCLFDSAELGMQLQKPDSIARKKSPEGIQSELPAMTISQQLTLFVFCGAML
jgi:hypothetical protein